MTHVLYKNICPYKNHCQNRYREEFPFYFIPSLIYNLQCVLRTLRHHAVEFKSMARPRDNCAKAGTLVPTPDSCTYC